MTYNRDNNPRNWIYCLLLFQIIRWSFTIIYSDVQMSPLLDEDTKRLTPNQDLGYLLI